MSKKVRKAVFPAAGLGTRFLPATKVIPKEMLALVDKPILQYGVEEAIASGIEHIILVTGRGKGAMEDHFDISYELDATLERKGKKELLELSRKISSMARISSVRQKEPLGLGHAVLCAKELVGDEPFAVILPDDVIDASSPCLKQMIDVFDEDRASARMACWPARRTRPIRVSTTAPGWWRSRSSKRRRRRRPSSAATF
jgi:UTP--glucose-1-phosphate uridylyltransferase